MIYAVVYGKKKEVLMLIDRVYETPASYFK